MGIEINKRLIEVKPGSFIYEFQNSLSSDECKNIINRFEEDLFFSLENKISLKSIVNSF